MTLFQAWHLPPEFSLLEEEIAILEESKETGNRGGPIRYASLSEERIKELMTLLSRERARTLVSFPVGRVLDAIDRVARRLLDSGDPLRKRALETLGPFAAYSPPMAEAVLDGMARGWRKGGLWELLRSEFPDPGVLDGFRPGPMRGQTRALGFPTIFHLGAGTVPGVSTTSMIRGLLVKSAALLKPGLGDLSLPLVFVQGLEEEDPELAGNVAVLYWPVSEGRQTQAALRESDLVVAYGSDETMRWVRQHLPPETPLRAYRHRMGFGLVGRGALGGDVGPGPGEDVRSTVRHAARSVALFDQKGCVSPHVFFVERGGRVEPEGWAALLGDAFRDLESVLPSGIPSVEEGVAIQHLRGAAELNEGMGVGVVHHGGKDGSWTVLFLPKGHVEPSCLNRTVRVIPVNQLEDALEILKEWAPYLQTVGVAGLGEGMPEVRESLARLGVSRISSLGEVPWPKPWWRHDGSGPLNDLVRWTDVEEESGFS